MKKLVACICLLVIPLVSFAAETDKRAVTEQLLEAMKAEKMVDTTYSQVNDFLGGLAQQLEIKESERHIFERFLDKVETVMATEMSWQKVKEPLIDVYLKHYTEKELNDLLAFYNSESGKALVEKMPLVMQDSSSITQGMFQNLIPQISTLSQEMGEELKIARSAQQ